MVKYTHQQREKYMSNLSIQEQTLQTFNDNISYFEKYQPALFQKISSFQVALEKGYYESKYDLEYIKEGYFDVKELATKNYLYASDSFEYAKNIAKSVDFKKEDNLFIVSPKFSFSKEALEELKKSNIYDNDPSAMADIIAYINHSVMPEKSTMKNLEKFIFFGVGLGLHLQTVNKKINSDFYLIIEDDLELFHLSLFTMNYKDLAKDAELYFVVFEEDSRTKEIMSKFLEAGFMHNHYIKFLQTLHQDDKKIKIMQEVIASQNHIIFPFHAYFNKFLRPLEYIKQKYNFLNLQTTTEFFEDYPVLIAAAGPSLQKNLQWLKENQHKFIIIALTSSLTTLEKMDIIPDIITHLDPYKKGSLPHLKKLHNKSYLQDKIALLAEQSPPEIIEYFNKKNVFLFPHGSRFKKNYGTAQAACVGSMSYALSLHLKAKNIYLLGLDLALDSKTASTHSSSHPSAKALDTSKMDELEEVFKLKESIIKVKGNFQEKVLTTASFYISIDNVNGNTLVYKQANQTVYNLSDGAYFKNTYPTKIDSLNLNNFETINKKIINSHLKKLFKENSTALLSEEERTTIRNTLAHIIRVKKILEKHVSMRYTDPDNYKYALYDLSLDITANSKAEATSLNLVLLYYMQLIFPYIFDMLNTSKISNIENHIQNIDKMLTNKLLAIVTYFEEKYEDFFEE